MLGVVVGGGGGRFRVVVVVLVVGVAMNVGPHMNTWSDGFETSRAGGLRRLIVVLPLNLPVYVLVLQLLPLLLLLLLSVPNVHHFGTRCLTLHGI